MKKIVLLVALCLCVGNLFAQDADKLRDEGDAALKAKDYATVVTKYGESIPPIQGIGKRSGNHLPFFL